MKHIITVQHTQSIHHTNGMVGSWTDWDLTELEKIQADHIGKKLSDEVINSEEENIIIVSHGDLLSIWNAMYIGLPLESFYEVDIHGPAGGVSHLIIGDDGKHRVRHINDMSYISG